MYILSVQSFSEFKEPFWIIIIIHHHHHSSSFIIIIIFHHHHKNRISLPAWSLRAKDNRLRSICRRFSPPARIISGPVAFQYPAIFVYVGTSLDTCKVNDDEWWWWMMMNEWRKKGSLILLKLFTLIVPLKKISKHFWLSVNTFLWVEKSISSFRVRNNLQRIILVKFL